MLTCFDIADYFIHLANETGSFVSNLKLQKLVYYAQAWHLAFFEDPLFVEEFEAWVHGPVVPDLYHNYKHFGWQPINEDVEPELPDSVWEFLDDVADEYFGCDAYDLKKMTHLEDPWLRARGDLPMDEPSDKVIQKEWIQEYYGARVKKEA